MAGRHAAGGIGDFVRGLLLFVLKWFLFGVVVFLIIYTVIVKVPDWFPSGADQEAQPPVTLAASTSESTAPATTLPPRTIPPTTRPTATTTATTVVGATTTSTVPPTTTTSAAPSVQLAPGEITVRVLNSTSRSGLAATVTNDIQALGYLMLEQGNYSPALSTTTIFYIPGYDEAGADLAAELPGAVAVQPNPAGTPSADLLVVLGASYP